MVQRYLKQAADCPAKWVSPQGIHLTLCFLGEISQAQVEAVKGVMASTAPDFPQFRLSLAGVGAFPGLERPQTVWTGLSGDIETLCRLQIALESGLSTAGYKPESRPYRPHLTLARIREEATPPARRRLGEAIRQMPPLVPEGISVSEISLMRSELFRSGAVYSRIHAAKLRGT
jgi:2'-5' RNA ligase